MKSNKNADLSPREALDLSAGRRNYSIGSSFFKNHFFENKTAQILTGDLNEPTANPRGLGTV